MQKTGISTQKTASEKSRAQYLRASVRIAEAAERRAKLLNRKPVLMDLATTLPYRHLTVKKSTLRMEVASLRQILADTLNKPSERPLWTALADRFTWIESATEDQINQVSAEIFRKPGEIMKTWGGIPDQEYETFQASGAGWSKEEFCERIAREITRDQTLKAKDRKSISWRDYKAIELELSYEDPHDVLRSLGNEEPVNSRALLRIFIAAIFITGMRPVEVWNCSLLVPDARLRFTNEMRSMVRQNPSKALLGGYLIPLENAFSGGAISPKATVLDAVSRSGAPCVMMIRSAKQTNANQDTRSPIRLLILEGVPEASLGLLCAAGLLRMAGVSPARRDNLRANLIRKLKDLIAAIPHLEGKDINLYSFRHSFATRARRACTPAQAAAMTGHTVRKTLYAYGERNVQQTRRPDYDGGWLPSPAPEVVEVIEHAWILKHDGPDSLPRPGPK